MKRHISGRAAERELLEQKPLARRDRLVVEELEEETLVYDRDTADAHCLNRTAALVWRSSDGATTVAEMAELLRGQDLPGDETIVWMALTRLERAGLLDASVRLPASAQGLSRKEALRVLGRVAGLSLLLPAVSSITAPLAAQTASCVTLTQCAGTRFNKCGGLPICGAAHTCCAQVSKKSCGTVAC